MCVCVCECGYVTVAVSATDYVGFKGQVLGAEDLDALVTGLRSNNLLKYTHLLTGEQSTTS